MGLDNSLSLAAILAFQTKGLLALFAAIPSATVVPITLVIIVLLLYLNFRNLTEVAIIMGTLPLALVGGFWLLYLLDYNMSVAVGVGFIALSGVAVEIGVIMLVYLNQALEKHRKEVVRLGTQLTLDEVRFAVIDGSLLRVRPIMMTVLAIIAGLLPIMLGGRGQKIHEPISPRSHIPDAKRGGQS